MVKGWMVGWCLKIILTGKEKLAYDEMGSIVCACEICMEGAGNQNFATLPNYLGSQYV